MALIKKNRKIIIIDIGSTSKKLAANVTKKFLKAKAINKIDLILLTHMHDDHINGVYDIVDDIKINKIGYTVPKEFSDEYLNFENLLNKYNISKFELNQNDKINIGDIEINVLMPLYNKKIYSKDVTNSNSSVYHINSKNINLLFMGDATIETEKYLLESNKNFLENLTAIQIGHHGSKTSSDENYIKSIEPCIAIISAKKEKFGHPHLETMNTLNKYGFNIKLTEKEGAIKLKI